MSGQVTHHQKLTEIERIIVTLKRDGRFQHEVEILKAVAEDLRAGGTGSIDPIFNILETLLRKIERNQHYQDHALLLDLARQVMKHWPTIRLALIEKAQAESEAR